MEITINFYQSLLPSIAGKVDKDLHTVEIEEGTKIRHLLRELKVPVDEAKLLILNGVAVTTERVLENGDRLSILPAVSGG